MTSYPDPASPLPIHLLEGRWAERIDRYAAYVPGGVTASTRRLLAVYCDATAAALDVADVAGRLPDPTRRDLETWADALGVLDAATHELDLTMLLAGDRAECIVGYLLIPDIQGRWAEFGRAAARWLCGGGPR